MDSQALAAMIAQEAKELKEAPVILPIVGTVARCHICGSVCTPNDLKPFDTHIVGRGVVPRYACANCHPDRNT